LEHGTISSVVLQRAWASTARWVEHVCIVPALGLTARRPRQPDLTAVVVLGHEPELLA
jgi:hypothetical protein